MNFLKQNGNCRRLPMAVLFGTAVLMASVGCGPIQTISNIQNTKAELKAAKTADADVLAPYEYTASIAYLDKAREEHGHSDFAQSNDFSAKALKYARSARTKAMEAKADGVVPDRSSEASGAADSLTDVGGTSSFPDDDSEPALPEEKAAAGRR